jgi:DNA-binding CsgD family transcriptional regulator
MLRRLFCYASSRAVPRPAPSISKEQLERLYIQDDLSTPQVAARLGTNRETVRKLIKKYGIPMRSRGGGKRG